MAKKKVSKSNKSTTRKEQIRTREKKKLCIETFKNNMCNVSEACESIGIARKTFYEWKNEDPKFNQAIEDAIEHLYDRIERRIHKKCLEESETMLKFVAKTKMKNRGYVERQEIEHSGDALSHVTFEIIDHTEKKEE